MKVAFISAAVGMAWGAPALACYTGPMPLQFVGHTARLSSDDESALRWQMGERLGSRRNRLLVIFYAAKPNPLLEQRRHTVRAYLLAKGIAQDDFVIAVTNRKPAPQLLAEWTQGRVPSASVELTSGGCG
jgi:hypothetical protein